MRWQFEQTKAKSAILVASPLGDNSDSGFLWMALDESVTSVSIDCRKVETSYSADQSLSFRQRSLILALDQSAVALPVSMNPCQELALFPFNVACLELCRRNRFRRHERTDRARDSQEILPLGVVEVPDDFLVSISSLKTLPL